MMVNVRSSVYASDEQIIDHG